MTDSEVTKLLQTTKALKAVGGDIEKLAPAEQKLLAELSGSSGQRLRFAGQLKLADQFIADLGALADPRGRKLFANISEGERRRLFDIARAESAGSDILKRQANDFALGRASSVAEYVELFESYLAKYKDVLAQKTQEYKDRLAAEIERRIAALVPMAVRFDTDNTTLLTPLGEGAELAIGWILAITFDAMNTGTWQRLRLCAATDCRFAFYDASRNRTGTWCSMSTCGNRAKVRAYQQRQRGRALPA